MRATSLPLACVLVAALARAHLARGEDAPRQPAAFAIADAA